MVHVKAMPWHAEVRLVKCVVFVYKNPICYSIWQFKEYFLQDEVAMCIRQYTDRVHATPEKFSPASAIQKTIDSGH